MVSLAINIPFGKVIVVGEWFSQAEGKLCEKQKSTPTGCFFLFLYPLFRMAKVPKNKAANTNMMVGPVATAL